MVLFLFLGITYYSYQKQYKKDIHRYVQDEVDFYKKSIYTSNISATQKILNQKEYYKSIHQNVKTQLNKNPNIDLVKLKQKIKKKYLPPYTDLEIYLINREYVIYKTTFLTDLGLDLSVISDAKEMLDNTTKDSKIYMTNYPSTDALDLKYKSYTYSKLDNDTYMELGFIDNSLTNVMQDILYSKKYNDTKITLYNVSKDEKQYYYYSMGKRENISSKEQYYKKMVKFPIDAKKYDKVVDVTRLNKQINEISGNIYTVYVGIFDEKMFNILGFENVVMKLELDISDNLKFLDEYKNRFIVYVFIVLILQLILYFFIKRKFTKPVENILDSLQKFKKIDDKTIILLNNELSEISKKYNILFDSFNYEIQKNKFLLEENKQFIADTVHQIRTPLSNIMMNSDMIQLYHKDESLIHFVEQINASINMLNNSYEDLSYIITFDTMEYKATNLPIKEMLEQRVKFFETISKVNDKNIILNAIDDFDYDINQIELERLIDNNISNGIKYSLHNTDITVNLIQNDYSAILEFRTYGKPIKDSSQIFMKSYREHDAKRGLGLGLYMVKNICEKYNVSYEVRYEDNQNIFAYTFKKYDIDLTL
jgi:signal transduction histidine kinase